VGRKAGVHVTERQGADELLRWSEALKPIRAS